MRDNGCLACKHFSFKTWSSCKAFPDGIPHPVISGEVAHFDVLPDQMGLIIFESDAQQEKAGGPK